MIPLRTSSRGPFTARTYKATNVDGVRGEAAINRLNRGSLNGTGTGSNIASCYLLTISGRLLRKNVDATVGIAVGDCGRSVPRQSHLIFRQYCSIASRLKESRGLLLFLRGAPNLTEGFTMSERLVAVFTPFENLTDPRVERTRRHDLFELVVTALCATIAGSDSWMDMERFGNERLAWLRTFLKLENGIPSHDTFGRVFARLDPAKLAACIEQWFIDIGKEIGKHIAIDGKTLRRSFDKAADRNPLHLVSAVFIELRRPKRGSRSARSPSTISPMKSRRYRCSWNCSISRARRSPSTRWAVKRTSRRRSSIAAATMCWRSKRIIRRCTKRSKPSSRPRSKRRLRPRKCAAT